MENRAAPFARAKPSSIAPITASGLTELLMKFRTKSIGENYFGPAWVTDDGIPCIVFVASSADAATRVRQAAGCAAIGWRWDGSPSLLFSLTILTTPKNPRPHIRWMRAGDDAVVEALRTSEHFLMIVATSDGKNSGWLRAKFYSGQKGSVPSLAAMDELWEQPRPGIYGSRMDRRIDPFDLKSVALNQGDGVQIPLWADPASDVWSELSYAESPWAADLPTKDLARAAWGRNVLHVRSRAATFIEAIVQRQLYENTKPVVDSTGNWIGDGTIAERAHVLVARAPLIGVWLAAMAGPTPTAESAYRACYDAVSDSYSLFCVLEKFMAILSDADDAILLEATKWTFDAVLRDFRITHSGTHRPWIANTGSYGLEIKSARVDLDAPIDDIQEFWSNGLEIIDLIDAGNRLEPWDFPAPLRGICESLADVKLEDTHEDAQSVIDTLLLEAQEARQWSIPWGARVEVDFGPFNAVRIFETDGEFSCNFIDVLGRYHHVAIGIANTPPRAASSRLVRPGRDSGEVSWNIDAELSLKLIAAAIVRDFLVVEERESIFSSRPFRRRVRGRDVRSIIYLPRVRYTIPEARPESLKRLTYSITKHEVIPHLRRAASASAAQHFLSQRYGVRIPQGFTFVRPHTRGGASALSKQKIYRSRSASKMLFQELAIAPKGARPAWFDFEKDCLRLLVHRGFKVVHQAAQRDGDGGIDLYAVDEHGQSWVVQCKCWAPHRLVGPEIVRELQGAISLAHKGLPSTGKGILITTSGFTAGAIVDANTLGFELIDGDRFAELFKSVSRTILAGPERTFPAT